jgi:uncharacterized membrane protein YdjX (TVP38/TMEM64 family)
MAQSNENEYQIKTSPLASLSVERLWSERNDLARKYRKPFLTIVVLILLGILLWQFQKQVLAAFSILQDQKAVSAYIQSFGILGPLVLGISHYLQVIIAFIPGHVFVLAGGYLYGFLPGLVLNMLFVVTASQFAFFLAKKAGRPLVGKFVDAPTLDKWQAIADKRGVTFFTIAFILPVFPSDAMNFVAGLAGMDGRKFLIANFFGRLPSVTLMSFIGAYGLEFSNTVRGLLVVVVVLVYVVGRYVILQIERQHSGAVYTRPLPQEQGLGD